MHNYDYFWWKFFPKKELTKVYISIAMRSFAISLLSIFVPLYLYKEQGYTLEETLFFFIFYSVIFAASSPLAAKFSARYGIKHSVLLSVPLYLLFVLFLYLLPRINTPLVIISGLLGISMAFYWMGMHLVFYRASDYRHRGEEYGKRAFFSILAAFFGPLVGGFLIKFIGFKPVFILVSLLLFFSVLFLFLSKENHMSYRFSFKSILKKDHWKDSLYYVSMGAKAISLGVVWPLFIFTILKDYFSLGMVGGLLSGISAVLFWLIGRYSDKVGKRKVIRWLTGFESLAWFYRAAVITVGQVFGATIFGAITRGSLGAPLGALQYDKAKGNTADYFVSREVFLCLGRILVLSFILMVNSLSGGLIFTGVANLAALLF